MNDLVCLWCGVPVVDEPEHRCAGCGRVLNDRLTEQTTLGELGHKLDGAEGSKEALFIVLARDEDRIIARTVFCVDDDTRSDVVQVLPVDADTRGGT